MVQEPEPMMTQFTDVCVLFDSLWHQAIAWTGNHIEWDMDSILIYTHWGRDKMAAIFQMTFSNGFLLMKMHEFRLKFHWSLFLKVQLTIKQHWIR